MPSLEQLLPLLEQNPADTFLRYGVAMELAKLGRFAEATEQFSELLRRDPNYVPAYFMGGRTQEQAGDTERAKAWYQRGIESAERVGDKHAAGEIAAALEMLG